MRKTNQKKNESIKRVKKYVTYIGEDSVGPPHNMNRNIRKNE